MTTFSQQEITEYFENSFDYHQRRTEFLRLVPRSGFSLLKIIPKDANILDVGCGQNNFKSFFPNLTGIDVIGAECDQQVSLLDFETDKKFDVVLCLGSVFGSLDDIKQQVAHIKSMMTPGGKIYWRNHPALPEWGSFPDFFYRWTEETHSTLAEEFGFTVNEVCKEFFVDPTTKTEFYRIYAEWTLN